MKRTLAVTGFTMLGTLLVFCNIQSVKAICVAVTAAFIALLFCLFFQKTRENKTLPTVFAFMIISLLILLISNRNYSAVSQAYNGKEISVSGYLTSTPYKQNGKNYYIIKTESVNGRNEKINIRIVSSSPIDFKPTDKITAKVKVFLLGADDETYLNYYKSKALTLGAFPTGEVAVQNSASIRIDRLILLLREKMKNSILHLLPNDYGAVITGLVLGDKTNLSEKTKNAFRFCGVSHLFAVSGLHITVWSMLFFRIISKLKMSVKKASAFSVLFCVFFMALTGFNPPVVRSGFMMIMIYISNLISREADAFNSIGLSLTVMLMINPYEAVSISLLLSVLATVGILTVSAPILSVLTSKLDRIKNSRIKLFIYSVMSIISVSISVSVFTVPIYIFTFKSISTLQILSNLLMVSLGTLCMEISGFAAILLVTGLGAVGKPLLILAGIMSKLLTQIAYLLSSYRYSLFPLDTELSLVLIIIFALVGIIMYLIKYKNKKVITILSAVAIVIFSAANLTSWFSSYGKLKLSVADVGNGTAVVMSYKGKNIVFSCEGEYFAESAICDIMNIYGISTVDYLCLPDGFSHYERILDGYNVKEIYADDVKAFENIRLSSAVNKTDRNVICIDDLTLGITGSFAQVVFGNTNILILFSDDNHSINYDCDILIYKNHIPSGVNTEFAVSSCGKKTFGNSDDIYYVSENGGISLKIENDKTFKYRRVS